MKASDYLRSVDYPGRIILMGCDVDGNDVVLYAITGRSRNSRNRVLRERDGIIRTEPYDESGLEDPSLIIYNAAHLLDDGRIVLANGDHTDTIYDELSAGRDIADALIKRTYEPDEPSYTPRISGVMDECGYVLSIIRKCGEDAERLMYRYSKEKGVGHIIHTYKGNGNPLPSFDSLPVRVDITGNLADDIWSSLDPDCRVSLFSLEGKAMRIINEKENAHGEA